MYNRYVPQPDGSYRRNRVQDQCPQQPRHRPAPPPKEEPCDPPPQPCPEQKQENSRPHRECPKGQSGQSAGSFLRQLLPRDLDTGDLIVILLLLLMAGDCREDQNTALLTLALYLFM